jgi:hypothetical protein
MAEIDSANALAIAEGLPFSALLAAWRARQLLEQQRKTYAQCET